MHRIIWLGGVAFLLLPLMAWSQEPSAIIPGSRIRITEQGQSMPRSGTVVAADADTVVLRLDSTAERMSFPLAGISRIEVSQGQKGHTAAGLGLGFIAGAGAGALFGALLCSDENCLSGSDDMGGAVILVAGGIGSIVGLTVGGIVGAGIKTDKWEAVPAGRWQVSLWPAGPGSFALALSMGF